MTVFLLSSCGSSNNDTASTDTAISGFVIDGPISGSSVTLHRINADGTTGEQVAGPFTTDENGQWSGTLPNNITSVLVVVAKGGQYTDDATGEIVTLAAEETLNSWFDANSPDTSGVVSPITDSLWQIVQQEMLAGESLDDSIATAEQLATDFWGFDPTNTVPDVGSGTAENQRYGAMLGGFSFLISDNVELKEEPFLSMNHFALTRLLIDDMADGRLDGYAIDGSRLAAPDGAFLPALSVNDLSAFFIEVNRYADSLQIDPIDPDDFPPYIYLGSSCPIDGFYFYGQGTEEQNLADYNNVFPTSAGAFGRNVVKVSVRNIQVSRSNFTHPQTGEEGYSDHYEITFDDPGLNLNSNPGVWLNGNILRFTSSGYASTGTAIGDMELELPSGSIWNTTANSADAVHITTNGRLAFNSGAQITLPDVNGFSTPHFANACGTFNVGAGGGTLFEPAGDNHVNQYFVAVNVQGVSGTVTLQNNDGNDLTISQNGFSYFSTPIEDGAFYNVSILNQPDSQTCSLTQSAGQVSGGNVTSVGLSCIDNTIPTFSITGTVSGLSGTLILQNNGSDNSTISQNGGFSFSSELQAGENYLVSVLSAPATQSCNVSNSVGTVSDTDVDNISVNCLDIPSYTVSVEVSGLVGAVVLQNNVGNDLTITQNGFSHFSMSLLDGASYSVSILNLPDGQTCSLTQPTGQISGGNVTSVGLNCVDNTISTFSITGTVAGLSGTLILQNNGSDNSTITQNGEFTFSGKIQTGDAYLVTVFDSPATQNCSVSNSGGTVSDADIVNISVTCTDIPSYSVGVTVDGLVGTVVVQNNAGNNLTITQNGDFTFSAPLLSGASYNVTILSVPATQACSISSNNVGTMGSADITGISVSCENLPDPTYSIGGSVSGLSGSVILQNNAGDDLTVTQNGNFTFATELLSAATYNVAITSFPDGQNCTLTNAGGTVSNSDISTIVVECVDTTSFTIGGTVSGLDGSIILKDAISEIFVSITEDGIYLLDGTLKSAATYDIDFFGIPPFPSAQDCVLENNTGTVSNSNITNVNVTCVNKPAYTIGGTVSGLTGSLDLSLRFFGDSLTITEDGQFVFTTTLTGGTYEVEINSEPRDQDCTATNAVGSINDADISNILIICENVPGEFSVGGEVTGLSDTGTLELTGQFWAAGVSVTEVLSITQNGSFTIFPAVYDNDFYDVKISAQPSGQQCYLESGSGDINLADVDWITVNCFDFFGYYSAAEQWNYYVLNDGSSSFDASNTACTIADTGATGCIHGGIMRVVKVPGETTCGSYTAEDALGALNWQCLDNTGEVRFVSTGLKEDKRLWDLVEPLSGLQSYITQASVPSARYLPGRWKLNSLIVSDGVTTIYTSPEAKWWSNDVRVDLIPDIDFSGTGALTLSETGAVYLYTEITGDRTPSPTISSDLKGDRKITLSGDHASITVNPGITLPSRGNNGDFISHSSDFNWIEGSFDTNGDKVSVLGGGGFSIFRYFNLTNLGQSGMSTGFGNNFYQHITLSATSGSAIWANGAAINIFSNYNRFDDIKVINTAATAITISGSFNSLSNLILADNAKALNVYFGNSNTIQNLVVASNDLDGISLIGNNNILLNVTTANNARSGLSMNVAHNNLLMNVASVDNNLHGINIINSNNLGMVNLASANNGNFTDQVTSSDGSGIIFTDSSAYVSGLFKVGNNSSDANADCSMTNSMGLAADCTAADGSDSTLTTGISLIASLVGAIGVDDGSNASDNNGIMAYTGNRDTIDWLNFENNFRTWTASGLAQRDIGSGGIIESLFNRGRFGCSSDNANLGLISSQSSCDSWDQYWHENGVIRDYSLKSTDDILLSVLPLYLSGDSSNTMTQTWSDASTTTFLRNSIEITGNGNGLCESNETCLYTPNIGAYQGHGALISAGSFIDGDTLTGIELMQYETNGY